MREKVTSGEKRVERLAWGINEAAKSCGVSPGHIRNVIAAGELPTKRLGRRVLILDADLRRWVGRGAGEHEAA